MAKGHPNHRRVKLHRSYTVEEIADLFHVHKNTVRAWIKAGLPTIDKRRPLLIHGQDLAAFIQARRARNKRVCQPDEIYCVRCRTPRKPAGGMVEYTPITATSGNLVAICPVCEAIMNRRASQDKLSNFLPYLAITMPQAQQHINERNDPSVNSDLQEEHPT
jgi:excisionase family DNA binding protein